MVKTAFNCWSARESDDVATKERKKEKRENASALARSDSCVPCLRASLLLLLLAEAWLSCCASGGMQQPRGRVVIFGLGYCGTRLARRLLAERWEVAGTSRKRPDDLPDDCQVLHARKHWGNAATLMLLFACLTH